MKSRRTSSTRRASVSPRRAPRLDPAERRHPDGQTDRTPPSRGGCSTASERTSPSARTSWAAARTCSWPTAVRVRLPRAQARGLTREPAILGVQDERSRIAGPQHGHRADREARPARRGSSPAAHVRSPETQRWQRPHARRTPTMPPTTAASPHPHLQGRCGKPVRRTGRADLTVPRRQKFTRLELPCSSVQCHRARAVLLAWPHRTGELWSRRRMRDSYHEEPGRRHRTISSSMTRSVGRR